jgi:RimJ/RimL family protein N-acetyltransferase
MDLHMRDATIQDSQDMLKWRNEAGVRRYSHSKELISEEDHNLWLKSRLILLPSEPFWVFENELGKIGFMRLDFNAELNHFKVSILLNPIFRGKGYGKVLLNKSMEKSLEIKNVESFYAETHVDNQASKSLFLNNGFRELGNLNNFLLLKKITNFN